jgi:hypothetical protein
VKINFPLELTDQPIGLDEDGFARIDRVETMLTPFFTLRRCHHHHSRAHPTIGKPSAWTAKSSSNTRLRTPPRLIAARRYRTIHELEDVLRAPLQ